MPCKGDKGDEGKRGCTQGLNSSHLIADTRTSGTESSGPGLPGVPEDSCPFSTPKDTGTNPVHTHTHYIANQPRLTH